MINARKELLEKVKELPAIKCALITYGDEFLDADCKKTIVLREKYSAPEYEAFLSQLNFTYDSGFGGQELFGSVWLEDGTWLERGEYDGSEWWEHKECPEIPDILRRLP